MTSKNGKIAIVAVAVAVVALLLILYVPTPTGPQIVCVAYSAYFCQSPVLHNGNFTAIIGQDTGTTWAQANIFVVISGSPNPTAVPPLPCEEGFASGITSGQTVNLALSSYSNSNTCAGFPKTVGSAFHGTLWAGYRTSANSTEQVVEIGVLSVKAS